MSATPTNGNGYTKYIGPVLFFLTLMAAINGPLIKGQAELEKRLREHELLPHHYGTAEKLSAMEVKFIEVETQMRAQREFFDLKDRNQEKEIEELKMQVDGLRNKH